MSSYYTQNNLTIASLRIVLIVKTDISKFIKSLQNLRLPWDCGVADLKMSDFGFSADEAMTLAIGARSMQGGLFEFNPCEMTDEDCAGIFEKSYR